MSTRNGTLQLSGEAGLSDQMDLRRLPVGFAVAASPKRCWSILSPRGRAIVFFHFLESRSLMKGRSVNWRIRLLLGSFLLSCLSPLHAHEEKADAAREPKEANRNDHHVHLLSPDLVRDWKSLGVPFSKPAAAYGSASSLLEESSGPEARPAKVGYAFLLPMAHLYGRADFREKLKLSVEEEYARVRRENDHVAREAARYPGRAVAFCGLDFLRPYAWEEMERCRHEWKSAGLKLHLASAGADLRNPDQLALLARIAKWAESEHVILMLHFDPQRRGLEVEDVERFIAAVLTPHSDLKICIAHLGGSGGYGPWTQSVFATFVRWLEVEAKAGNPRGGVSFDVSAVWLEEESEGVPPSTDEEAAALQKDLRRVGLKRIVFGSDYPVFDPERYARVLREAVKLDAVEWEMLVRNRIASDISAPDL